MKEPVGGFCFTHNAVDLIALTCGHYLRLGFQRLLFFDDRSSDGTYELLQALSRRDSRVSVEAIDIVDVEQGTGIKSAAVKSLVASGIRIVIPFDQDEFWNLNLASLQAVSREIEEGVIRGRFVQFIQDASVRRFRHLGPFKIRYRAPALGVNSVDAIQEGKPFWPAAGLMDTQLS